MVIAGLCIGVLAWGEVLRVYSARHYASDAELYALFEARTGIRVESVQAGGDALLERIRAEGENVRADVLVTVDIGRLWAAAEAGVLRPVQTETLLAQVPEQYRDADGLWWGLTKRARVIVYARDRVTEGEVLRYEDLAGEAMRGRVLMRSSSNVYNQSLLSALIAHVGEEAAEAWARGVVRNMARRPQSNDTGQIRAVAAGLGDATLVNHYYFLRLQSSADAADRAVVANLGLRFPNQADRGAHVNLSGAAVLRHARNPEAAIRFIEFLLTEEAQRLLVADTGEFPLSAELFSDPDFNPFGAFVEDGLSAQQIGENMRAALRIFDRVGWR